MMAVKDHIIVIVRLFVKLLPISQPYHGMVLQKKPIS